MAHLQGLLIQGIRSFSPKPESGHNKIKFVSPVTVIVGPNGCGKTTIIECLKFATSGDLPPGAKTNALFVHDPKLSSVSEVRAQVKLQFVDIRGDTVVVTKHLSATQKQKRVEARSKEMTIQRISKKTGEKTNLSNKCAEVDREMMACLGVSKAVLNNVIFCHQEDSNWPLSEPRPLKTKFDEIFAATKYTKALDSIRSVRKELADEAKQYGIELSYLQQNKERHDRLQAQLSDLSEELKTVREQIERMEQKSQPLKEELIDLQRRKQAYDAARDVLTTLEAQHTELSKSSQELRQKIKHRFRGTDAELENCIQKCKNKMANEDEEISNRETRKANEEEALRITIERKNICLTKKGTLAANAGDYERKMRQQTMMISEIAEETDIHGYAYMELDSNVTAETAAQFQQKLAKVTKNKMEEFRRLEADNQEAMKRYESDLQGISSEIGGKKNGIDSKRESIRNQEKGIKRAREQLNQQPQLPKLLEEVSKKAEKIKEQLQNLRCRFDLDSLESQIRNKEENRRTKDLEKREIFQRIRELQSESDIRKDIELAQGSKLDKETRFQGLQSTHEHVLQDLLGEVTTKNCRKKLAAYREEQERERGALDKDLAKLRNEKARLEQRKETCSSDLNEKRQKLTQLQSALSEKCGGDTQSLDSVLEEVRTRMEQLRCEQGEAQGEKFVYGKFVDSMKGFQSICPVCKKAFSSKRELDACKKELKNKITSVPERLKSCEERLKKEVEYERELIRLEPIKEQAHELSAVDIPQLERQITEASATIGKLHREIRQKERELEDISKKQNVALIVSQDAGEMDALAEDIPRLAQEIKEKKSLLKFPGSQQEQSMEELQAKQEKLQAQVDTLDSEVGKLRGEKNDVEQKLRDLEKQYNEKVTEKLSIQDKMQQGSALQKDIKRLTESNVQLEREIEGLMNDLAPLEAKKETLAAQKEKFQTESRRKSDELRTFIDRVHSKGNELKKLREELKRLDGENQKKNLEECEAQLSQCDRAEEDSKRKIKNWEDEINKIKQSTADDRTGLYEMQDEQTLRSKEVTMDSLSVKIRNKRQEIGLKDGEDFRNSIDLKRLEVIESKYGKIQRAMSEQRGVEKSLVDRVEMVKKELSGEEVANAEKLFRDKQIEQRTTQIAAQDLEKYGKALDTAIMKHHSIKMEEINATIKELWTSVYKGNDISHISIESEPESSSATSLRRVYNYRVVMHQDGYAMDMRGRCSAGQKVLASLIIRIALAESFCLSCGVLALDEPTTNLDERNVEALATMLGQIVQNRFQRQKNFQLIIITHDEEFVKMLMSGHVADACYRVSKTDDGYSVLRKDATYARRD